MSAVDAYLRQQMIARRLRAQGGMRIAPLLREVGCSYATLVRDLRAMERDGLLRRVHGGIVPASTDVSAMSRTPKQVPAALPAPAR